MIGTTTQKAERAGSQHFLTVRRSALCVTTALCCRTLLLVQAVHPLAVSFALLIGCSSSSTSPACTGNLVQMKPITLTDQTTGAPICTGTVTFLPDGPSFGATNSSGACQYAHGGTEKQLGIGSWDMDFRVDAPGYTSTIVKGVAISVADCSLGTGALLPECPQCAVKLQARVGDAAVEGG